ncbi:MAG: hypothetical protein LBV52_04675 [Spirochaetaceae bacterium]|jgi:hypothetical protein|nr:hypothetical protein [Spirochaetaceae bacterium]
MGTLIAGCGAELFSSLIAKFCEGDGKCLSALIPCANTTEKVSENRLTWNPASPVSARTLIVSAINRIETIDTAIISPELPFADRIKGFTAQEIDDAINNYVKGPVFLYSELEKYFRERKCGNLILINHEDESSGFLSALINGAWSEFIKSVLKTSRNEPFNTNGFFCSFAKLDQISSFTSLVYKTAMSGKKNCKLVKYDKLPVKR